MQKPEKYDLFLKALTCEANRNFDFSEIAERVYGITLDELIEAKTYLYYSKDEVK